MNSNGWPVMVRIITSGLLAALLWLAACTPGHMPGPAPAAKPMIFPTAAPTLSLEQTTAKEFVISDQNFDAVHSPVNGDANKYLILGNLPVSKPAADLAPGLAAFLGRWEGYINAAPVKKDRKMVLVIQEINAQEGKAIGWSGKNLQFPDRIGEIHFRVLPGDTPSIEFQITWPGDVREIDTFSYDQEKGILRGWAKISPDYANYGPIELTRDQSFYVYKDYARYLAGKRIAVKEYQNPELKHYGQGYLLYLPEGYEDQPEKNWPLVYFLHGYGDRGDNVLLLAKASPLMYIREKGGLPCIIAAPLLKADDAYSSFPDEYMDGVLAEIRANYRVDAKRMYVTGLSMGGEGTYRFAVHQPDTFAAIAPLSAYVIPDTYAHLGRIKDLPVWAIHGAEDTVVVLARGEQPVNGLKKAGSTKVKFTVLANHDHDTWTDTYSDAAFYDWLFQHQRP